MNNFVLFLGFLVCCVQPVFAQKDSLSEGSSVVSQKKETIVSQPSWMSVQPVSVHVMPSHQTVRPGDSFEIAFLLTHEPDWHTYWLNPGDVGAPTTINWKPSDEVQFDRCIWPTPHVFDSMGFVSYGFESQLLLKQTCVVSSQAKVGEVLNIQGQVNWVACKETCVPGSFEIDIPLDVSEQSILRPEYNAFLDQASDSFPEEIDLMDASSPFTCQYRSGTLEMDIPDFLQGYQDVRWFCENVQSQLRLTLSSDKNRLIFDSLLNQDQAGVLEFVYADSPSRSYRISFSSQKLSSEAFSHSLAFSENESMWRFWLALILAFIGGFILNAMPCVLPVLSLKLMSFVKQAQDRQTHPFRYGFSFTVGVLVSFWVLSCTLLLLRFYGHQIGWGFQMQSFPFVVAIFLVLVLFSYNLFGFYEMGQSLTQMGSQRQVQSQMYASFLSGVFATVVATPCTAPFMGSALGYALTVPWYLSFLIFTFLGLGLSFPYLVLSAFPSCLKWIPRPGSWMVTFKKSMGFLLLFSSLWILWQIVSMTASYYVMLCLVVCIVLAIFSLIYGRFSQLQYRSSVRNFHLILFVCVIFLSYWKLIEVGQKSRGVSSSETLSSLWSVYDAQKVDQALSEGSHVFINLTANWCATCQTNKLFVLKKDKILDAFRKKGVILFEGDWTERDPQITQLLEKYQRAGVPFYLLIDAKRPDSPVLLPEVLSVSLLLDEIDQLS